MQTKCLPSSREPCHSLTLSLLPGLKNADQVPAWFKGAMSQRHTPPKEDQEQLKAGMYGVVRSLLRALEKVSGARFLACH